MKNMYKKLAKNKAGASLQNIDGQVAKRKVGRPRKEGQVKVAVYLPKKVWEEIKKWCERHGYGKSQLIQLLLQGVLVAGKD